MNISAPFIRRPVATLLLSASLVLAGLAAYGVLPVALMPKIDFPAIGVSAELPGASAETMMASVSTPLIQQLAAIPAVEDISATNVEGATSITIEFALNRDIDDAAADVQSAIMRAQRTLPAAMPALPSYRKLDPTDAPVLLLALGSASRPLAEIGAFARDVLVPQLTAIEGVGEVTGYEDYRQAISIRVDPFGLAARDLALVEVERAIHGASDNTPLGTIAGDGQRIVLQSTARPQDAAAFRELTIPLMPGGAVRLGDIATVEDSIEVQDRLSRYDGSDAIILSVRRQGDSDVVAVADRIRQALPDLQELAGPDISIEIARDRTVSVMEAIQDVQATLVLTGVLMVVVLFVMTGHINMTAIPSIAVPISIIVAFLGLFAFGLSLDNITLLALTLSVGLVIDDAIVMHENIVRHIESGMHPFDAAIKGAGEVGFTIISMTLSLSAVFIPVLLMGGVVGRIMQSFAITVIVALLASALVSLTLVPMLTAYCTKPVALAAQKSVFEKGFERVTLWYGRLLETCLRFRGTVMLVFVGTVLATGWMMQAIPKGFLPQEDIGQLSVSLRARPDISFPAMVSLQSQAETVLRQSPHVEHILSEVGSSTSGTLNESSFFVELKDKAYRPELSRVISDLRRALASIAGIEVFVTTAQEARMGGGKNRGSYQFSIHAGTFEDAAHTASAFLGAMRNDPMFSSVTSDTQIISVRTGIEIDVEKATRLGVSVDQIRATLYRAFGGVQVATVQHPAESRKVFMELEPSAAAMSERLDLIQVRSEGGVLVPLSAVVTSRPGSGPLKINQIGQRPSTTVSFEPAPDVSLGEAVERVQQIRDDLQLRSGVSVEFGGNARLFQEMMDNQGLLLIAAVLTMYLVLGVLYGSLLHPLTILAGLPAAAVGALGALMLFGMEFSLMALIGMLTLIGIVKKNAIMMIDVAVVLRSDGARADDAIRSACLQRFRPIMMTTAAAIAGAVPIAIGYGASAELRQPLGVAVAGGLVISQLLTLFITPVIYLYFDSAADVLRRGFRHAYSGQ